MSTDATQPRVVWSAVAAAVLASSVDALYLALIASQGDGELDSGRVLLVASSLGAAALVLALAARPVAGRKLLLIAATAVLVVWTILGAASIGVLLLPATVLAGVAAARA
jgi:hypothetical protein